MAEVLDFAVWVDVTAADIERGVAGNRGNCPVAVAVARVLEQNKKLVALAPKADRYSISFRLGDIRYTLQTPQRAAAWIIQLDEAVAKKGEKVKATMKPFRFKLDLTHARGRHTPKQSYTRVGKDRAKTTSIHTGRYLHRVSGVSGV
ncbi:MAG TPA: hypothetical protein VFI41_05450 [Gemmatimonadales bacterium]|nr:hypothetical protein [Gemmatimonadales bacterium]